MRNRFRTFCKPALLAIVLLMATGAFMAETVMGSNDNTAEVYIVKPGDSLAKIALSVYGSAEQYLTILDANRDIIVDAGLIYPGQKLRIPGGIAAGVDWRYHDIADVNFVQQYAKLPQPENVLIVDSRPKRPKYDKGYIPTAISIPDTKFDQLADKLPENKDTLLIFYCGGPT